MHPLKKIFSSCVYYKEVAEEEKEHYQWFRTEEEVIGVLKAQMTPTEQALLNLFLVPHDVGFPVETIQEQQWKKAIYEGETNLLTIESGYRFVAFSYNKEQMTPFQFKTAICELFDKEVPILWESEHEGIMIEEEKEEVMTYEEMIDVLMSDLYVNIQFLVGTYYHCSKKIQLQFQTMQKAAHYAFTYSGKNVTTFIDTIPYFFMYGDGATDRTYLRSLILQEFVNDAETIEMIESFIHYNLNISETAKALHLHRNSLQYRLDRLAKRTGLDVRKVQHAMTAYLVL